MAATGDGGWRYCGEGDIQHDRFTLFRLLRGMRWTSESLAVASTENSPRSANQLRCDRLPFSRKLRRLIALQGLARVRELREGTVGIWREVWLGYGRRHTSIPKDTYHFPCRRPAHPRTSPTTRLPGDGGWQRRNRSHGAPPLLQNVAAVRQTALSPSARYT